MGEIHLHPMVVHFPIALFISALGFEMLSLILKKENLHQSALRIYILAVLTTPLVVLTGLWEADEWHLVSHPVFNLHKTFALVTMGMALVTLPILWIMKKRAGHFYRQGGTCCVSSGNGTGKDNFCSSFIRAIDNSVMHGTSKHQWKFLFIQYSNSILMCNIFRKHA